jgi:hypothetical protein
MLPAQPGGLERFADFLAIFLDFGQIGMLPAHAIIPVSWGGFLGREAPKM